MAREENGGNSSHRRGWREDIENGKAVSLLRRIKDKKTWADNTLPSVRSAGPLPHPEGAFEGRGGREEEAAGG